MAERLRSVKDIDFSPQHDVFPSPRDWRDVFLYQLLIDRFDDNQDHPPYDPKTAKRGRDPEQACLFQGGKIKGITRRLDYIKGLGCNAIWISPPFKNRLEYSDAAHGYAIQDFLAVDPRLGTLEDLREMVRQAHARGMYVILDIVINHTGNNWAYPGDGGRPFKQDGRYDFGFWRGRIGEQIPHDQVSKLGADDGVWPIELQDPEAYKRRGEIRDMGSASPEEAICGDFFALKDLDLTRPDLVDVIINIYKYWIAACDFDGFRMDTIGHTEPQTAAIFCNAIREYARSIGKDDFFIYAEIVAGDEKIQKYIGRNTPVEGSNERYPVFSACLDFPLYFVLEEVIKGFKSPEELRQRYEHFHHFYRDYSEAGQYFVTFVDNHDQMARPYRRFMNGVSDPKQAVIAIGYLLCNMGIPCVYYSTEQGFNGGGANDLYVREAMFGGKWGAFDTTGMQFFNPDNPIYQGIARVAEVRKDHPTLRYGREYFREISGNGEDFGHPIDGRCTLAFSRVHDVDEMIVCLNLDMAKRVDCIVVDARLNPPGGAMRDLLRDGVTYAVEEAPNGFAFVRVPLPSHEMAILKRVT
ncbi:MAG: alpha-amylase family glycosyl hydrolase [Tepidisphaeraceae bacterium]